MIKSKKVKKQSNAAKIRVLLAEGLEPKNIAKKLKVDVNYVHQVKWHWNKTPKADVPRVWDKTKKTEETDLWLKPNESYAEFNARLKALNDKLDFWDAAESHQVPVEENFLESEWANAFSDDQAAQGIGWPQERDWNGDMVNHPDHYTVGGIETIDFIEAKGLSYGLGNAVKYISRAQFKGKYRQDLEKAIWYIQRELDRTNGEI